MKADHPFYRSPYLRQLTAFLLASFGLVALTLVFWATLRANAILARSDNPRLVEAELRIRRGTIMDRHGVTLAETGGTTARQRRNYPIPNIGPAVGYYSFRHGTSGVEESYDATLRGEGAPFWLESWRKLLHEPQQGQPIQLTLDATWQQEADTLLADHTGALLLLELDADSNGAQIRALVSHPGYDPNLLDAQFAELLADENAPLLNRATQGQYQPGLVLQPFLLAEALERGMLTLADTAVSANRPIALNEMVRRCQERPPDPATWEDVLAFRCPGPMQDLGGMLGAVDLNQAFAAWGLTQQPDLPLNTAVPTLDPPLDAALAAIGQDILTVTPLQVGLALAALAQDGRFPNAQLVTAVQDESGAWVPETVESSDVTTTSPTTARAILRALPTQSGIAEHSVLVLSGPEESTNGWYLALTPAATPRYALVVVVENIDRLETAVAIGRALLQSLESRD